MEKRCGKDIPMKVLILSPENRKYTKHFFCDNQAIDRYFREEAPFDQTAVTYLFIDDENDRVVACVTLACSAIFSTETGEQFSTILPAMEILYFAVDEEYKHIPYKENSILTLSHFLLSYMLDRMSDISHEFIGAAKVALYSVPSAVNFYKRCNFVEFGNAMYGDKGYFVEGCIPMYYDLN